MKKALSLLGLSLIPVLGLILLQSPLLSLQSDYQKVRQVYTLALDTTRFKLTELSHILRAEPSLAQGLTPEGLAAVGRTLSGYIKAGEVDYIAVLDANCQIAAHSELGQTLNPQCPIDNFRADAPAQFQWRADGDTPRIQWTLPLSPSFVLLLATKLNDTWIASHPELQKSMQSRNLRLGPATGDGVLVVEEGRNADQIAIASLYGNELALVLVPQLLRAAPLSLQKPLGIALTLFLLCLVYLIRCLRRREKDFSAAHAQLYSWAHDLNPLEQGPAAAGAAPLQLVQHIQERMNKLTKANFEQIQKEQHQNHLLQQQIVSLESRLMEHKGEQAWFHQVRSLHEQMMACAKAHIEKLHEAFSVGEDLSHIASHQLARPAQKLFELSSRWQIELGEVSARKFVRSLSERIDVHGQSELEQSLHFILEQSHELNHSAINLTLLTQRMLQDLRSNLHLAEHWHQMMGGHESKKFSLLNQLNHGQALIQLQDPSVSLRYENLLEEDADLSHLDIPASKLTSAIYHCNLALIETARSKGASELHLISQLRKRNRRSILVLSVKGDWHDDWSQGSQLPPKAEQHLYLAIQLMQSHPLKISQLPGLNGVQAITLMWDDAQPATPHLSLAPALTL